MTVKTSDYTNASAEQDLVLRFVLKEGTNIKISKEDAKLINNDLLDTLQSTFEGEIEINCNNCYREGFDEKQGEILTDDYVYEIVAIFKVRLYLYDYYYKPATMYDDYGDPGSPAEEDFEIDYDKSFCLEDVDYDINEIKSDLKKTPIIGDYIDLDTVEIDIKEVDWDTLEIKHDSYEDDEYYRD